MPCGKKLTIPKGFGKVAKFGMPHGGNLVSEAKKMDRIAPKKMRPSFPKKKGF